MEIISAEFTLRFLDTQIIVCYSKFLAAHEKSGEIR
jgi:hypothetical protein